LDGLKQLRRNYRLVTPVLFRLSAISARMGLNRAASHDPINRCQAFGFCELTSNSLGSVSAQIGGEEFLPFGRVAVGQTRYEAAFERDKALY